MNKKLILLITIFLMLFNPESGKSQAYSNINKDINDFKDILYNAKKAREDKNSNKENKLTKELEKKFPEINLLSEKKEFVTPDIRKENPLSSYYVRTNLYLLLCKYSAFLEDKKECDYLTKLIESIKNVSRIKGESLYMKKDILLNRISRKKNNDFNEAVKMKLDSLKVIKLHVEHVNKIKELCNICKLTPNIEIDCDSIVKYSDSLLHELDQNDAGDDSSDHKKSDNHPMIKNISDNIEIYPDNLDCILTDDSLKLFLGIQNISRKEDLEDIVVNIMVNDISVIPDFRIKNMPAGHRKIINVNLASANYGSSIISIIISYKNMISIENSYKIQYKIHNCKLQKL